MPSHLITPDEVEAWLAGSAVQAVLQHRTNPVAADLIERFGVEIGLGDTEAAWGQGFYACNYSEPQYGSAVLRVAVRLTHPLVLPDSVRGAGIMDDLLREAGTEDMRAAVLGAGYDGLVIHFPRDQFWVVAYRDEQVKIVVGETP
jgi:hypothetical protein